MDQLQILLTVFCSYSTWSIICLGIASSIIYWIFYIPMNWIRDIDDITYNYSFRNDNWISDVKRRNRINQIRKLRKIGMESEIPPPYPNGWYAITESERVKPEMAINVSCLGEQFVVFRTKNLKVYVLDAYCPHMGANLGIGGKVYENKIECPFHGWTFNGDDGQCTNIPYSSIMCAPKSAKIKTWKAMESNDLIFVWYHAENEEPWEIPIIKEIENKEYVYHGQNEFKVNCHIQDIPENGADLAHFNAVHGASMLAGSDNVNFKWTGTLGQHNWNATWSASNNVKHESVITLKHALKIFGKIKFFAMDVRGVQIGPSYVQLYMNTSFGLIVALQTVTPIEPFKQRLVHRFYAPRSIGPYMKALIFGESIMVERDINIWNHKKFMNSPCLVREDRTIKLYRTWYNQFYSENSKSFFQAKQSLNW